MSNLKSISPYSETKSTQGFTTLRLRSGFTIVELLVVIVVIGILASITVVSFTGISQKAIVSSLQSDLSNSSTQLKMYQAIYGSYPTALGPDNCPSAPEIDTKYCLRNSANNTYTNFESNGISFTLTETNTNGTIYTISDSQPPQPKVSLAISDPANWIQIGTQVWSRKNLDVGTMVPGTLGAGNTTNQTHDGLPEKYCYQNNPANCDTYGGLYQWGEAMQYNPSPTAPAVVRGLCPAGSHIPSDDEWKTLEMFLGMSQGEADTTGFRGSPVGTKLQVGGSSGLEILIAGILFTDKSFVYLSSYSYLWTSSGTSGSAWNRNFTGGVTVGRNNNNIAFGFSVRCLEN